jgi:cell division protein FtsI (penicillin-binding protein 3)
VVSPGTAHTLQRLLARVVEDGTGRLAAIPGYEVAGKTGTAQKLDAATGRYSRGPGVLSFVGMAPVSDPRLVMLVMLDEPRTERWGSEAAAPIFAAIGAEVLRYLDVAPGDARPVQIVMGPEAPAPRARLADRAPGGSDGLMPDLRGRSLREALATLAPLGVEVQVDGRGRVAQQTPAPGEPLAAAMTARLTLVSGTAKDAP